MANAVFKIQGKDVGAYLENIELSMQRTYKGEITRTQTGRVSAFPNSFITVGFDLSFSGARDVMKEIEQIFLSDNTVELIIDWKEFNIKGQFSCTSNQAAELRNKGETAMRLSISVVSDGSNITDKNGSAFTVKYGNTTVLSTCYYGKVYTVPSAYTNYKLDGFKLPSGHILVLGNHNIAP